MSDRWKNYFIGHDVFDQKWLVTAVTHWGFHESLYGMIQSCCSKPAKILDVGCGPGWSDLYLASMGYEVMGIDNEPALIELANSHARKFQIPVKFEVADAFNLSSYHNQFDLVYSCGVLEHFDRDVTIKLLKEQAKCASYILIQIPTQYTKYTAEITDERIYSIYQLSQLVKESGLEVIAKFGYGELTATRMQRMIRLLLPRAMWRLAQNLGYAYSIAVIGKSS